MHRYHYLSFILSIFVLQGVVAQNYTAPVLSSDQNYIYTISPQTEMATINPLLTRDVIESILYFDGLGRPIQQLGIRQSNSGFDIISHFDYDGFGRQVKDFLPYAPTTIGVVGSFKLDNQETAINNYYLTHYQADLDTSPNPYSQKSYETSPLNRVLEQAAPGKSWKLDEQSDTDHTIKFDYQTNITGEARLFQVTFPVDTENPVLVENGHYKKNVLHKTITKDENWQPNPSNSKDHTTEEFKDLQGRVLLKRTYNLDHPHDTYYVYDDFGNLTYVLSPEASKLSTISQTVLDDLGYQYKYDRRNRLIEKKIPGKGWEYIIYDNLDRPVFTQDANRRDPNQTDEWLFTRYDILGRVILTGIAEIESTRAALQGQLDTGVYPLYESRSTSSITTGGTSVFYTNEAGNPFTTMTYEILSVNYYDSYDNINLAGAVSPTTVFNETVTNNTKGLSTSTQTKVLGMGSWITSVVYYDDKSRAIQVYMNNAYLSTVDLIQTDYDFVGKTLKIRSSHVKDTNTAIVTVDTFTYDHVGRLLKQIQCVGDDSLENTCGDDGAGVQAHLVTSEIINATVTKSIIASESITLSPGFSAMPDVNNMITIKIDNTGSGANDGIELISENVYDELGQLETKKVGNNETNPLQEVDYAYTIRGWLKDINDIAAIGTDLFSFNISYDEVSGSTALYNGNISQTSWKSANVDNAIKKYDYTYDAMNRITSAIDNSANYNLTAVSYDQNGNIQNLERKGHLNIGATNFGIMDDLSYDYGVTGGNQLKKVTEGSTPGINFGFKDGNTTGDDYSYDVNGNMKEDKNKGITLITYNHLNLPTEVQFGSSNKIEYFYDAGGAKLKKIVTENSIPIETSYAGNFIYKDNALEFFSQPEGYIMPNAGNSNFDYVYQYKDHLGNIRLSYSDSDGNGSINATTEIIEENNYYPFGLKHKGYNDFPSPNGNDVAQKFKYNGVELEEGLGLDLYEMDVRSYDPAIARFTGIDPITHHSMSPFVAYDNNPIFWTDPTGADAQEYDHSKQSMFSSNFANNSNGGHWTDFTSDVNPGDDGYVEGETEEDKDEDCCGGYEQYFADAEAGVKESRKAVKSVWGGNKNDENAKNVLVGLGKGSAIGAVSFSYLDGLSLTKAANNFRRIKLVEQSMTTTKHFRILGRIAGGAVISYDFHRMQTGQISKSEFFNNSAWTGVGMFGGPLGLGVSTLYWVMGDLLGGHQRAKVNFERWQSMSPKVKSEEISRILDNRKGRGRSKPVCFIEGTKILMADLSSKNIEDVKVGDLVLSVRKNDFLIETDTVLKISQFDSQKIIKLQLKNDIDIEFTEDHPIWITGKGWCVFNVNKAKNKYIQLNLKKIEIDDLVLIYSNGRLIEEKIVKIFDTGKYKKVYNLHDVSKNSTFFANKILVHNRNVKL